MASIDVLRPVTRQNGVQIPGLLPGSRWIDSIALLAATVANYTIPSDSVTDPSRPTKGKILGITCTDGPLYINFGGTAVVNVSTIVNGSASMCLRTDVGATYLVDVPAAVTTVSFICANACEVTIEVWN